MADLLNIQQLSKRLKVPATWLRAEADAGRIPCLMAGPCRRYFVAEAVAKALVERASHLPQAARGPVTDALAGASA